MVLGLRSARLGTTFLASAALHALVVVLFTQRGLLRADAAVDSALSDVWVGNSTRQVDAEMIELDTAAEAELAPEPVAALAADTPPSADASSNSDTKLVLEPSATTAAAPEPAVPAALPPRAPPLSAPTPLARAPSRQLAPPERQAPPAAPPEPAPTPSVEAATHDAELPPLHEAVASVALLQERTPSRAPAPATSAPARAHAPTQTRRPATVGHSAPRAAGAAAKIAIERAPTATAEASAETVGSTGLPPGVRPLTKAFTRALPYGSRLDSYWRSAAFGLAGRVRLRLTVAADGALTGFEIAEPQRAPQAMRRLLERAHALLKAGHFALHDTLAAGSETLDIEVSVSQHAPLGGEFANPNDVAALGFTAPEKDEPGRAYFTLASGRHVEAKVSYPSTP